MVRRLGVPEVRGNSWAQLHTLQRDSLPLTTVDAGQS